MSLAGPQAKRVLVADILGEAGKRMLAERADIACVAFSNMIAQPDFRALLTSCERVHGVILGLTAFGRDELQAAHGLQVVSRIGVGFDAVDVPAMTRAGIPVMICPNANHRAVAEHTLGFMLALAKRLAELKALVTQGRWDQRYAHLPTELDGRTVLIVGCGRIGSRVAQLCAAVGMQVQAYDPYVAQAALPDGVQQVDGLEAALPLADYVTLHCPRTEETLGLISARQLRRMKPGACLVNTARGGIVDEQALYQALRDGHLGGAALDVFSPEPPALGQLLYALPNVLCSPHLAGVSGEAVARMAVMAAGNVLDVFDGKGQPHRSANPQVLLSWPQASGANAQCVQEDLDDGR